MQIGKFYYDFYFKITKTSFKYSLKQTEYNKQYCHVKEHGENWISLIWGELIIYQTGTITNDSKI